MVEAVEEGYVDAVREDVGGGVYRAYKYKVIGVVEV